jgi:pimeloyl-ACP methyl ester carboxylesterase
MTRANKVLLALLLSALLSAAACSSRGTATEFRLSVAPETGRATLDGRVFVLLDDNPDRDPLYSQKFIFALDVRGHDAKVPVVIGRGAKGYPCRLKDLPPGQYAARAVADIDTTHWSFTVSPGNIVSRKSVVSVTGGTVDLLLERAVPEPSFTESEFRKEARLESRYLTDFHGRPTFVEAAVVLPPSYFKEPERRYPAVYTMPGYGGSHYNLSRGDEDVKRYGMNLSGLEKVFVFLELNCAEGTHCFVDSENNGPWGRALLEEFIPYIESTFRVIPEPAARLLMGQSSGAWAALWLQVEHPDDFGGAWPVSPDPVDFRSFCGVDLYAKDANVFYMKGPDGAKELRPLVFSGDTVVSTWKDISDKEAVIGPGGFMETFEAAFSPKGKDGRPARMWDRRTGRVDAAVVDHWKRYDVSRVLRENWADLAPRLRGKLHIFVADDDVVRLDDPVRLLRDEIEQRDEGFAAIKILASGGHGSGVWSQIVEEIHAQMDGRLASAYPGLR